MQTLCAVPWAQGSDSDGSSVLPQLQQNKSDTITGNLIKPSIYINDNSSISIITD
jgi:hypothetical protein